MSIKRKLTATIIGISVASVLLTVGVIMAYLIYDMNQNKVKELELTAAITADRNSAALIFLDNERATKNLEVFQASPAILSACVFDGMGLLFAGYSPSNADPMAACQPQLQAMPRTLQGMLIAVKDVEQAGQRVGTVFLASDKREIDAYVHKILLISGTATALVLLATLLLAIYFQRTISGPILDLAATAQSITQHHNYSVEAKQDYSDETGVLARAFNEMIAEIRKRDESLKGVNETLERKVIERTKLLEEEKKRAEAASEAKSEFLRNMSHEFRTPLHALISLSAYGIKENETAERGQLKKYFEMMQNGAKRLSKLVDEVLDLAKLEHGEHVFALKSGDMRDAAVKAVEVVQSLAKEKGLQLRIEQEDAPSQAVFDHDKIIQVITNLLGNAIKFTPTGRGITVRTESKPDQVLVSVIDEGVGIPEGEVEMIFDSFRQSSRTNTGAGGTGLGLAICRSIITAHRGSIWAENNKEGHGARVSFRIPAALEEGKRVITYKTEDNHDIAA